MSAAFLTRITLVNDPAVTLDTTLTRQTALLTLVGTPILGTALLEGTATGDIDMDGFDLFNAGVVSFISEYDNGLSGAAKTISLLNGTKQKVTLDAGTTLTISSAGAGVGHYQIRIIQDATGGHAVTFSGLSSARWLGAATPPGVNTVASGESILSLFFDGAGIVQSLAKVGSA